MTGHLEYRAMSGGIRHLVSISPKARAIALDLDPDTASHTRSIIFQERIIRTQASGFSINCVYGIAKCMQILVGSAVMLP